MPTLGNSGAATTARYTTQEKTRAIRLCRERAAGKGTSQGVAIEVASQLGYGPESVRRWWKQQDIDDGQAPGRTCSDADRIAELEAELNPHAQSCRVVRVVPLVVAGTPHHVPIRCADLDLGQAAG